MKYYAAPLEGITGHIYRRAHHDFFPGADKYFTPFIMPGQKTLLRSKEAADVLPENNAGLNVVPQILTNQAEDFLNTAAALSAMGYSEVNLNLGCPSGTVTAKHRGAGFLAMGEELRAFFDEVFEKTPVKVSVKTRIGVDSPEEFPALVELFNRYPIAELTVHPRLLRQKYSGRPDLDAFALALEGSTNPVCYNGDIFTVSDAEAIAARFPTLSAVMVGRGLIADPALLSRCVGIGGCDRAYLRAFHDRLLNDYAALKLGDRNLLFRMKELWCYMGHMFPDSGKYIKAINKSQKLCDYVSAVDALFRERDVSPESSFRGTP